MGDIKAQVVEYSQDIYAHLSIAMGDDKQVIESMIQDGLALVWHVEKCGYVVASIEFDEVVYMAGEGKNAAIAINKLNSIYKRAGIKTWRIHTESKGMLRMLNSNKLNCKLKEYVISGGV